MLKATLGEYLDFSTGSRSPARIPDGRFPVYGANGVIGYAAQPNASGPLIVLGRVGSYCGSVRYCDSDVWVTDNALVCRAKEPAETRYWYYALQNCRLNEHRAGSGQPLLNQAILCDVSVRAVPGRQRQRIAELLGAFDDKVAVNQRVVEAAEQMMVAIVETISDQVPLCNLAQRSTVLRAPAQFDHVVAHFSLPAFDAGATPARVNGASVRSSKFVLSQPCVLFAKLNPRIPRIWNVVQLPSEMAVASPEFVVLRPIGVDTSALWAAIRQPDVSQRLQQQVAGTSTSHQRIAPRDLMDVVVRDVRCLSADAAQTITTLGALCHARRSESLRLSGFRDALLPLLMSTTVQIG
ncbi:restriction endonuclease subunit S [Mycobacterium montefiorense]|uniref:Type I restriction/modification system specificity determinant HsdS n=1 Tax=Mycobacterium montefiorense TaxID=154654 RepID=A0AA37PTN2_9MYCO|nr:restriction endonuclease subunit S [Mycobacterium montefiorense]GBG35767.1 type I restriction/modification system specificity determinant HsdS [Mycobacterium montefiorense]GKU35916.1 type I restriction/modification system specificity determinant HsdS [Mycobacterium montefiorense]GKU41523.1 type I restriction/modification system specificity determinant HsdS [Mycobacterium montefiorense]GKU44357.1 type I restriction/modification system specificity determinant HsdS [Mycobacterium montefiorense]